MRFKSLVMPALVATFIATASTAVAQSGGISIRVTPPQKAQFLQFQRFDLRVEATATAPGATVETLTVTLDGRDITAAGTIDSPSAGVRNWVLRDCYLGVSGTRAFAAAATGKNGAIAVDGSGQSRVGVRQWKNSFNALPNAKTIDRSFDLDALAGIAAPQGTERSSSDASGDPHLGTSLPSSEKDAIALDPAQPRAKNVILFIGDGMGAAHRTAARVLSKGYSGGKANGSLAMDRFPFNGMLMTSSLNSLITDSAPGAHNYSTGNKTNNGMEGVFPDNTAPEDDNPRIENLPEWITRNFGKVTGIVSDAFLTDATPAAMVAHTQNRGNGTLIGSQYFDLASKNNMKVLLGGGSYHFIPKSRTGSRRTDERDVIQDFKNAGYQFVETRSQLNGLSIGSNAKLLGLFNLDNMNVAFDKLHLGDPSVTSAFPDQPFLDDMTRAAIGVLKQYPEGFFLMVEAAHIDKQAHAMDAERSVYDVIQLDKAVEVALAFAAETNSDTDPTNDTLVVVGADHECAGMALPGVSRPDRKGKRDYVKAYDYSGARNDAPTLNFTNYVDANGDGYPENPDPDYKLIVSFGANSDRYEDWQSNAKPKSPTKTLDSVVVANPDDPDKSATGGYLITGVIENGDGGSGGQTSAVHTMTDIPVSAFGPGASQFAKISDNTEAFFYTVNSLLGQYPVPLQY
ncbi:MAG: alkaline phosphatase [Thermoanaerobaculia bacterium]|jgi:alkaline phosphatase